MCHQKMENPHVVVPDTEIVWGYQVHFPNIRNKSKPAVIAWLLHPCPLVHSPKSEPEGPVKIQM